MVTLKCVFRFPDKTRGVWNEGGLFGERMGWHLPGFDASGAGWMDRELTQGSPNGKAGVGFFVTTFELNFAQMTDVFVSLQFEEDLEQPYRVLLFVNGWKFGKVSESLPARTSLVIQSLMGTNNDRHPSVCPTWALSRSSLFP